MVDRLAQAGLGLTLMPDGYDVDDAEGLKRLESDLRDPAMAARAPATAGALALLF